MTGESSKAKLNVSGNASDNVSHNDSQQTAVAALKTDPLNHFWIFWLYFFEYWVITGFLDRLAQLRNSEKSDIWLENNLFVITQFLYQLGVLIARSSLYCLKLKITEIITFVLFLHFWVFFSLWLFYVDVTRYIIFGLSLSLGIFGGWGFLFSYFR